MQAINNPRSIVIGRSTLDAIATHTHKACESHCVLTPVQCFQYKRFMRSTIYGIRLCSANGNLVIDLVTYGNDGDMWQVSTDDGSTYHPVQMDDLVTTCISFFSLWQD